MKVLIVSEPGENGVFTFVEALCYYLTREDVAVHLAYSDRRGSDRLAALVRHVEERGGQTANMEVGSGVGLGDLRAFFRLSRLAARVQPDVIHCHSSKGGALGRLLALTGVRAAFVYHAHAYYGMRPGARTLDGAYDAIEALLGRIGTTIVVSADERRFARGRLRVPESRLTFIANGVDTDRFAPAGPDEKRAIRDSYGIPRHAVLLGDPETLYRAFAAAAAERPDIHLFHVGTGELEHEVDRLVAALGIGNRVTRLRYLSDPTGFYKAVDGFILTSTYEGLSLASLEAMSANLPLILSRAPGNVDLLELGLTHAWGAAPGASADFARCIGLWHASHLLRPPPNHRSVAAERFDSRKSQAAVLSYYREAARRGCSLAAWSARLPVLAWLVLIAFESTDRFSRANTRRILYPAFHALTGVSYSDFYDWNYVMRKCGHVFLYGTLGALLYRLARFEVPGGRSKSWSLPCALLAVAGTALVASLDEWHQTFVPSRTGTLADVLLDTGAALLSQALIFAVARLFWPGKPSPRSASARHPAQPTPPIQSAPPGMAGAARGLRARS